MAEMLGKDGQVWDLQRWIEWASSGTRSNLPSVSKEQFAEKRASGSRQTMRRSGIRRECKGCFRQISIGCKKCPKCGAHVERRGG